MKKITKVGQCTLYKHKLDPLKIIFNDLDSSERILFIRIMSTIYSITNSSQIVSSIQFYKQ